MLTILAIIALTLGALFSLVNWYNLFRPLFPNPGKYVSPTPILGALLFFLGLLHFPNTRPYAWLAIFLDYGTFSLLFLGVPIVSWEIWKASRFNLLHRFTCTSDGRHFDVRLYKRRIFVINCQCKNPVEASASRPSTRSLNIAGQWDEANGTFRLDDPPGERHITIFKSDSGYAAAEPNYPTKRPYKYDRLDGLHLEKVK